MAASGAVHTEEDEHLMRNFGEHALMTRIQDALKQQLMTRLARVEAEVRAAEEARTKSRVARESAGVELYGVQQQLARLQVKLEATGSSVTALHDVRVKAESELKTFRDGYAARRATLEAEESKLEKFKGELDGVTDTLRQVESYTKDMAAEIALTKRAATKAEVALAEAEKAKLAQDLYVDTLSGQIRKLSEQISLYESRIGAQREEAASAGATLADAAAEIAALTAEKKALMAQWQSTLVAMRRRDEALNASQVATREQQQALESMDAEESNIRRSMLAAQETHAKLQDALDREEAALKQLEGGTSSLRRQYDALEERHGSLAGTLEQTEAEVARINVEQVKLVKAVREAERERMLADRSRFGVEDAIAEAISSRVTNEKAARSLLKDAKKLIDALHEVELQCAEMENSIAAAKLDALGADSSIASLREVLAGVEGDLTDKERLIERYEAEIRSRHDAIDKKMAQVDRLNRKFEKMVADAPEVESMGPLHAEIHNLGKAIAAHQDAADTHQKRWLADQTALVAVANDCEVKSTRLRELQSQAVLLDQKRIRLDAAIAAQSGEIKRLAAAVKTIHEDMGRINGLIARNTALASKLAAASSTTAAAFSEELKVLEADAAVGEARLSSVRGDKEGLLSDIMECERQVILWEKKVELEKETQEALDPSVGESEIASMERAIHRMRLRHEAVLREQERLVGEMERAIHKREIIAMKNKSANAVVLAAAAVSGRGKSGVDIPSEAASTRVGLKHRADALRGEIESKLKAVDAISATLSQAQAEAAALEEHVRARSSELTAAEQRAAELQRSINASLYEKQKGVETVASLTRLIQRLEALEAGRLPALTSDEAARVMDKLAEAEAAQNAVRILVEHLAAAHEQLKEVLDRVSQLVDIAPTIALSAEGAGAEASQEAPGL